MVGDICTKMFGLCSWWIGVVFLLLLLVWFFGRYFLASEQKSFLISSRTLKKIRLICDGYLVETTVHHFRLLISSFLLAQLVHARIINKAI